jgi:hypothetical protein
MLLLGKHNLTADAAQLMHCASLTAHTATPLDWLCNKDKQSSQAVSLCISSCIQKYMFSSATAMPAAVQVLAASDCQPRIC